MPPAVDLRRIAEWAGIPVDELQRLNPELRRWTTPIRASYELALPGGTAEVVKERLSAASPNELNALQWHTVKRGETLSTIARKLRVNRTDLAAANYLRTASKVIAGQRLLIPRMPSAALLARAGERRSNADVASGGGESTSSLRRPGSGRHAADRAPCQGWRNVVFDRSQISDDGGAVERIEQLAQLHAPGRHAARRPGWAMQRESAAVGAAGRARRFCRRGRSSHGRNSRKHPLVAAVAFLSPAQRLRVPQPGRTASCTSPRHAGTPRKCRGVRRGRTPGSRRGRRRPRTAVLPDGGPAGCERAREPRPRARGHPKLRLRVSDTPNHHQSGARRCAEGWLVVRPAHRARHSLAAEGVLASRELQNVVLVGELSLDGSIHGARGVLPIAAAARKRGAAALLLPAPNVAEAAVVCRAAPAACSAPWPRRWRC